MAEVRAPYDHGLKDMSGMVFGKLTVKHRAGTTKARCAAWLCECECGSTRIIEGYSLRAGKTVSCGCWHSELTRAIHTRHGKAANDERSAEYRIWGAMKARCGDPNNPNYHHYGGRGIHVCARWREDFAAFFEDMGLRPSASHSLDRIDNDKGYGPDNCRWATMKEQGRNKRSNCPVVRSDGAWFPTTVEAAEATGVSAGGIWRVLAGRQRTAGGFGWRRAALLRAKIAQEERT